jgi:hypothetical protein
VFKGLIDDIKSSAASFIGTYLARVSVAVPFLVALGFVTGAVALELTERFGARTALWMLAGGFCAVGLLASLAVAMKEQQEMEAEEEQQRKESGIGEITSAVATQVAMQLPAALVGALLQKPSTSALPVARLLGRNMPLVLLILLVALLLWPTEQAEEPADQAGEAERPAGHEAEPMPAEAGRPQAPSGEERLQKAA